MASREYKDMTFAQLWAANPELIRTEELQLSDTDSKKTRGYLSLGTYSKLLHLADLRVPLGMCLPKHSPYYTYVSNPKQKR